MDYQATLSHLLGLIGSPVRVEVSAESANSIRAAAGFVGVLERGSEDEVLALVGGEEAINFRVVPEGVPDERASWFIVARSSFQKAVVVDGPLGETLTLRTDGVDISIKPAPEAEPSA